MFNSVVCVSVQLYYPIVQLFIRVGQFVSFRELQQALTGLADGHSKALFSKKKKY